MGRPPLPPPQPPPSLFHLLHYCPSLWPLAAGRWPRVVDHWLSLTRALLRLLLQVSLHLLSPITRGLARRGILQSGTLNAPWSWMSGEKAAEVAKKLIDDVGCNATKLPDAPLKVS